MRRLFLSTALLLTTLCLLGQQAKRPLDHEDIQKWNRISGMEISADGDHVVFHLNPWIGDQVLKLKDTKGKEILSVPGGEGSSFTYDGEFLIYTQKPLYEKVMDLKRAKTKKKDMPGDALVVYHVKKGQQKIIGEILNHKTPSKWPGWLAYQSEPQKAEEGEEEKNGEKKESKENGYHLRVLNLDKQEEKTYPFVTAYYFAEEAEVMVFHTSGDGEGTEAGIYLLDLDKDNLSPLHVSEADYKRISMNEDASLIGFLAYDGEEKALVKSYDLYLSAGRQEAEKVLDHSTEGIPEGWIVSEYGRLSFSENGKHLYFGSAPEPLVKDTAKLEEEVPEVQVWHYDEPVLHTRQVLQKRQESRRTYTAVYHIDREEVVQLATEMIPEVDLINEGNSRYVVASTNIPYGVKRMWTGASYLDVYLIDIFTGEKEQILEDYRARIMSSPGGAYLYWYYPVDSCWYTYELASHRQRKITTPATLMAANELNDVPNYPSPYYGGGWMKGDEALLLYDRYDIWKVDPKGEKAPENLTRNGRSTKTVYRLMNLNSRREQETIDPGQLQYLTAHNEISRAEGFYSLNLQENYPPEQLLWGDYRYRFMGDALEGETVVYTRENFQVYPDLLISDLSFRKAQRISKANPQQKEFLWGTAEIYSWVSLDGKKLEGMLIKPENFDPDKEYPMIVNFYEKSSQGVNSHRIPEPHRSTIDYHYYTSNGYVIFNPDVYYQDGYPGESAYNCVIPGVTSLIEEGFIDKDRIGAQGHSWGGYQVAYLATRTDIFAAIESGAPVVNMFSAYGGIRWWSGLNRSFQYEHTQSRIGKTIWESPLRYIENSPLFTMDKVTTPLLIMHNDADGHVPWYQGIEYFVALRRLQKPAWMLNYPGEPHWPQKIKNKIDFQKRMAQFFDHYLKDKPMPLWMKEGIPAVEEGVNMGYELQE